jgi:putative transposase
MAPAYSRPPAGHEALRRCRVSLPGHLYHVTTSTRHREPVFAAFHAARVAARQLNNPALLRDSRLMAWVLMPDHLHVLIQLGESDALPAIVARMKSGIAREVNRVCGRTQSLWQVAYFDHLLRAEESVEAVSRYIIENPVRAGLVERVEDYPHWDAYWL